MLGRKLNRGVRYLHDDLFCSVVEVEKRFCRGIRLAGQKIRVKDKRRNEISYNNNLKDYDILFLIERRSKVMVNKFRRLSGLDVGITFDTLYIVIEAVP